MHWIAGVFAVLLAYLLGSLSFAVIISRWMGLNDPRSYGSGNPGATNVLRSGHQGAAALTLFFDALKGMVPVWVVCYSVSTWGVDPRLAPLVGLAALMGHVWPVFFQFRGGKGVATAAGVLIALNPWLGLAVVLTWLVVALCFRYSSLAALAAAALAPLYEIIGGGWDVTLFVVFLMSLLLIGRHRGNIQKLWLGTEPKLGRPPASGAR